MPRDRGQVQVGRFIFVFPVDFALLDGPGGLRLSRYLGAFGLNRHWDGYFAHAALYVPSRC